MIINNNIVLGLYMYSNIAEYTRGDIVAYKTSLETSYSLYVCEPINKDSLTTVPGEIPTTSENFHPYLLNKLTSIEDYNKYIHDGTLNNDSYITTKTLQSILDQYMSGFTKKGIIGNYIGISKRGLLDTNVDPGSSSINNDNILSELMIGTINNGIFKVSRSLPELKSYIGFKEENGSWSTDYCILRLYTFSLGEEVYRVLELIDHVYNLIFYRYCKLENESEIPEFRLICIDPKNIKTRLDLVYDLTLRRLMDMETMTNSLKNNFRFHTIKITPSKLITLLNTNDLLDGYFESEKLEIINIILLLKIKKISSIDGSEYTIGKTYNISIDFSLNLIKTYSITDDIELSWEKVSDNIFLSVNDDNTVITSINYQLYFAK